MKVYSVSSDDMSRNGSSAMEETVRVLVDEGLLDLDKGCEFVRTHACLFITKDTVLAQLAELLGLEEGRSAYRIVRLRPAAREIVAKPSLPKGGTP